MTNTNRNTTGLKTLNRLGTDPRVSNIYRDSDGIWCELADGFQNGTDPGTHAIHEDTARDVISSASLIQPCGCDECLERMSSR